MEQLFQLNVIMKSKSLMFWYCLYCWRQLLGGGLAFSLLGRINNRKKNESVFTTCCLLCRRYAVDGISLQPTWASFVHTASAEDHIDFSLLLMTGIKSIDRSTFFKSLTLCYSFHD